MLSGGVGNFQLVKKSGFLPFLQRYALGTSCAPYIIYSILEQIVHTREEIIQIIIGHFTVLNVVEGGVLDVFIIEFGDK